VEQCAICIDFVAKPKSGIAKDEHLSIQELAHEHYQDGYNSLLVKLKLTAPPEDKKQDNESSDKESNRKQKEKPVFTYVPYMFTDDKY